MSRLEAEFERLLKISKITGYQREYKFHEKRRWRFDFAWIERKIAVEVEGLTHYGKATGRHQSLKGYTADCEKYNTAILEGWRVMRFTEPMLKNLQAIEMTKKILEKD